MAISITREKVVEQWGAIIDDAGSKAEWVMATTESRINDAKMPNITIRRDEASAGMFSGDKRSFLVVSHGGLRDYWMLINARNFGRDLAVSWFLTVNPGLFKKTISKYGYGSPHALSQNINLFHQQDLQAFIRVSHNCLQKGIEELMGQLKQDYSKLDRRSNGFLSVW
jgi:hypothetical protein